MEILICCDSWLQHEYYLKLFRVGAPNRFLKFVLFTGSFNELEKLTFALSYCSLLIISVFGKFCLRAKTLSLVARTQHKFKFKFVIAAGKSDFERVCFNRKFVSASNWIPDLDYTIDNKLLLQILAGDQWETETIDNNRDNSCWRYGARLLLPLRYCANSALICLYSVSNLICCGLVLDLCNKLLFFKVRALPFCVKSVSKDLAKLRLALNNFLPLVMVSLTSFACADATGAYKSVSLQLAVSRNNLFKQIILNRSLSSTELCQKLSLPETEGKVFVRVIGFAKINFDYKCACYFHTFGIINNRLNFTIIVLLRWSKLALSRHTFVFVLFNYPTSDSRIGNGVGLDTIASVANVHNLFARNKLLSRAELIQKLLLGITNYSNLNRLMRATTASHINSGEIDDAVVLRMWGCVSVDPFALSGFVSLSFCRTLDHYIMVQPTRGYGLVNPNVYHSAFTIPCRVYWLSYFFCANALTNSLLVNVGKHGSLEWLPGRANALSRFCHPELVGLGLLNLYFYILNDPGEGTQAKRRTSSVIIDHYLPPMQFLRRFTANSEKVSKKYLRFNKKYYCNLLNLQFRNGLHIYGLFKIPSIRASLATLLKWRFNYTVASICNKITSWDSRNPLIKTCYAFCELCSVLNVSHGLTASLRKALLLSMSSCYYELYSIAKSINAKYILPGLSSSWARADKHILPTGRNFYSKDVWNIPTPWAYSVGVVVASKLLRAYYNRSCCWLKTVGVSVWATSNMRTGGDDIAIILSLMGVRPVWELSSSRVIGFEILPLKQTRFLRVSVLTRMSGLFRDVYCQVTDKLYALFEIVNRLQDVNDISFKSTKYNLFSSKPGYYGVGIQELIDSGCWANAAEIANKYASYGCYCYNGLYWEKNAAALVNFLSDIQVVLQSQDNREHDILDSDDYYQFEGGMTAAVRHFRSKVCSYHIDTSRSLENNVKVRQLKYEIDKVLECKLLNKNWVLSLLEYGYRGVSEIISNLSYFYNFAITSFQVSNFQFASVYNVLVADAQVRNLISLNNKCALSEIKRKLFEATVRGVWTSVSNNIRYCLGT
ncbi:Aerobic cobaltochelatase subunit CobN [Candidatus Hodgkinia cicadicola]|nr:Aerobic cobaltochelatase subunit CobN [Candidatus Hodgkinia cicadicola]